MLKRGVLALAIVLGLIGATVTPAQAIPPGPNLIVLTYYSGTTMVGQKWWGCPGQTPGQWGVETSDREFHFVPC